MSQLNVAQAIPGFQPIVDVARGAIVGYEVLARQRNARNGLESLGHLFHGGQMDSRELLELDRSIRQQAVRQLGSLESGFLSLNISPDWINQLTARQESPLLEMLTSEHVDPNRIVLEITEQRGSIERIKRAVRSYREKGYRIAIDDFGAGNSHMHRIMELEPDILKLDMKLFKDAANGGRHYDLVHSVSQLAEKSGCQLVCEGVETEQEFAFGLELGSSWMQGYLFAPAADAFQPASQYADIIGRFRQRFLANKVNRQRHAYHFEEQVVKHLHTLRQQCLALPRTTDQHLGSLTVGANSPILKFYLCDSLGTQVSSNMERLATPQNADTATFSINPQPIGVNWCWRPHFYQLLAVREALSQEFIASAPYRDVDTRQLCRSYVSRLRDNLYLLVDVDHSEPEHNLPEAMPPLPDQC